MTYRDRRLKRAERLDGWSEANEAKAGQAHETARGILDVIPAGQPILVGHYSEGRHRRDLDRADTNMRRAVELDRKAERQASAAEEIRRQADRAIYDDDPDAIERLRDKLARLERQREAVKAHNKEHRGGRQCDHSAECDCRSPFPRQCGCTRHPQPSYVLQNLGGEITRTRKRLALLEARKANTGTTAKPPRLLTLKWGDTCSGPCRRVLHPGETAYYDRSERTMTCPECHNNERTTK